MKLYRTKESLYIEADGSWHAVPEVSFDELLNRDDLHGYLAQIAAIAPPVPPPGEFLAPIGTQEVWASGVTYFRSRNARMEESKDVGGGDFYERVYSAERPELFFKSLPHKVIGPGGNVRIRRDATWSVPEPELVLVVNAKGQIVGYTIGNDMSSRDIEGLNPLYLPQAKVYDGACAIGPCVLVQPNPLAPSAEIHIEILREGASVFVGAVQLSEMMRSPTELVEFLFRENTFAMGCLLFTGTGIVPPDSFTLQSKDEIRIAIEGIGQLVNSVS